MWVVQIRLGSLEGEDMQRLIVCVAMLALSGCATAGNRQISGAPNNYRTLIAEHVRKTFHDAGSIRLARISAPIPERALMPVYPTAFVCIQVDAKNAQGVYTGPQTTSFSFTGGQLTRVLPGGDPVGCFGAEYGPFPEVAAS